jgi:hypothetical protein
MQTPIVNETPVRRSIADPDDFGLEITQSAAPLAPAGEPAPPAWEATTAPRRSMA